MLLIFRYSRILNKLALMTDENGEKILWGPKKPRAGSAQLVQETFPNVLV